MLACGRAAWMTRRIGDHDMLWWTLETGYLDATVDSLPDSGGALRGQHHRHGPPRRRPRPAPAHAARDGRAAARPRRGSDGRRVRFADDLAASVAWGDARRADFLALCAARSRSAGWPSRSCLDPGAAATPSRCRGRPQRLRRRDPHRRLPPRLRALGARARRVRRARLPGARRCASTAAPGLWFAGVHFLRKRSRRCSTGSARTPRSSPAGSPRRPSRRRSRSPRGSRARGTRAGARPRSRPTRRPSAGTPRGRRA